MDRAVVLLDSDVLSLSYFLLLSMQDLSSSKIWSKYEMQGGFLNPNVVSFGIKLHSTAKHTDHDHYQRAVGYYNKMPSSFLRQPQKSLEDILAYRDYICLFVIPSISATHIVSREICCINQRQNTLSLRSSIRRYPRT